MLTIICLLAVKKFILERWILIKPHADPVIRDMQENGCWNVWGL